MDVYSAPHCCEHATACTLGVLCFGLLLDNASEDVALG
ncbi:hypothetical protein SAMN05421752_11195 [Natronorubrum thiooxidans]|uniref:Uncharacterized protein n=1 Tax=Natronorubrum thiooxidans TaxID=308853 RepID=A0A1N7GDJ0_9EURY|nr:hypothetical protein SAMN05421752_11195 [Natronorubrum thiooxidans]